MWTSYAEFARWGIGLVRTDPDAPRHRGISYLVVDMEAAGIEIRPLVQITGEAEFNEVFLDEVFVPDDHLVGGLNEGWAVANTTLAHERGTTFPFKEQVVHETYLAELYDLAHRDRAPRRPRGGRRPGPGLRRAAAAAAAQLAHALPPRPRRRARPRVEPGEAGLDRHDPAPVGGGARRGRAEAAPSTRPVAAAVALVPGARRIAGGTTEVQRTIIGERLLGLPRG